MIKNVNTGNMQLIKDNMKYFVKNILTTRIFVEYFTRCECNTTHGIFETILIFLQQNRDSSVN